MLKEQYLARLERMTVLMLREELARLAVERREERRIPSEIKDGFRRAWQESSARAELDSRKAYLRRTSAYLGATSVSTYAADRCRVYVAKQVREWRKAGFEVTVLSKTPTRVVFQSSRGGTVGWHVSDPGLAGKRDLGMGKPSFVIRAPELRSTVFNDHSIEEDLDTLRQVIANAHLIGRNADMAHIRYMTSFSERHITRLLGRLR